MNDKKKGVKQTQKKQTFSGATKVPGNEPYQNLNRLIQTIKKTPIIFNIDEKREIIIEKEKKEIIFSFYYSVIESKTWEKEFNQQKKIKSPQPFDLESCFRDTEKFIRQHGVEKFIRNCPDDPKKIESILSWEAVTGEKIKYTSPLTIYEIKPNDGPAWFTARSEFTGQHNVTYKKLTIPPGNPIPLEQNGDHFFQKAVLIETFLIQFFDGKWTPGENALSRRFAIPADYFVLEFFLYLFAGDPGVLRRKALKKDYANRTPEEQRQVAEYADRMFVYDETLNGVTGIRVLDTPKLIIDAYTKNNGLFFSDKEYRKGELLRKFYKTIGSPEGLRHLYGVFLALYLQGDIDYLYFDVNKHLDLLGYKKNHGSHREENKKKAKEIVLMLCRIILTVEQPNRIGKDGKPKKAFPQLFTLTPEAESDAMEADKDNFILNTLPWYTKCFLGDKENKRGPRFAWLLKTLPKENHRDHPYTLLLAMRFAIYWRMKPVKTLKLTTVLSNLNIQNTKTFKENIKKLASELEYMKTQEHIGDWSHDGDHAKMEESSQPENITLTFTAPDWAKNDYEKIQDNRELYLPTTDDIKPMPFTEFMLIYNYLKKHYSQREMASHMGISRTNLSNFKSGRRSVSNEMAQKIRAFYFQELEKDPASSEG